MKSYSFEKSTGYGMNELGHKVLVDNKCFFTIRKRVRISGIACIRKLINKSGMGKDKGINNIYYYNK